MDAVAESFKKTHIVIWIAYAVCLTLFSIPLIFSIQNERAQRKLTAHRQQTKAKRREWLDAHPEEKGAPPSADARKTAVDADPAEGRRSRKGNVPEKPSKQRRSHRVVALLVPAVVYMQMPNNVARFFTICLLSVI